MPDTMGLSVLIFEYQTLLCPVMFSAIGEKTLYIFAASNMITIPMVWALYPESNQRTLEDMDLLFAAKTPWAWDAEKNFARLKAENPNMIQTTSRKNSVMDPETGKEVSVKDIVSETEDNGVAAEHVDRT